MGKLKIKLRNSGNWPSLFAISVLIAYFFIFMEWLFFVTKPSFMDGMSVFQKVGLFLSAGGALAIMSVIFILIFLIVNLLSPNSSMAFLYGAALVPAILLSVLALLLLDNFTYTIFKFGIVSTQGIFRAVYAILLLFFLLKSSRWVIKFSGERKPTVYRRFLFFPPLLLILASAIFLFGRSKSTLPLDKSSLNIDINSLPNILILGSDGLNASHTSVYGYDRDTTPFLKQLADQSLVAENAFPNAGNSSGSITSILTGKLPISTRVLYPPNALKGLDAYQHLPGILKDLGYFTVEIGLPRFIDAYDVNIQDGFDLVNQHFVNNDSFFQASPALRLGDVSYFLYLIFDRLADRILHIFYIRTMQNPYRLVTQEVAELNIGDRERINQLVELINSTEGPLFVHVHLMGTHGYEFHPSRRVYSAGEEQNAWWQDDFYDDAILDFDDYVKELFDALSTSGKLDHTIVVIYTDHNQKYLTTQRIPLMIYFPGGKHAGRIQNNVQNVDINPTLLDYLKVPIPEWMAGISLLRGEPPQNRLIFSAAADLEDLGNRKPPYDQFGTIGVVACDRWYELYTKSDFLVSGPVKGHTTPCIAENEIKPDVLKTYLLDELQESKFNVTTLPKDIYESLPYGKFTRAQAAIFILKTIHGSSYDPPPATGMFLDVPSSDPYARWVEQILHEGIMDACSDAPKKFCPNEDLTLANAAKMVLKSTDGDSFLPPTTVVQTQNGACSSPASPWVEELRSRGALSECKKNAFLCCPDAPVDIRQLSEFLSYMLVKP